MQIEWDYPELRTALHQRIANSLALARWIEGNPNVDMTWPCCWVRFRRVVGTEHVNYLQRLCEPDCVHWHHRNDVWRGELPEKKPVSNGRS
jgi:hypothetical protein